MARGLSSLGFLVAVDDANGAGYGRLQGLCMLKESSGKIVISERLSLALDVARGVAATYVVLHHVAHAMGWLHGIGSALRFGQEAVLIFFVLSGFVIHVNERKRALRPRGYYLRRLRRIYPPLLMAILISAIVASYDGVLSAEFSIRSLLATIFSLQDISALKPGVIADPFMGNDPLWSLSYEVAFYLIYPAVLRLWYQSERNANLIVGAVGATAMLLFAALPNHFLLVLAYFPVWWCGAMAAEAYSRGDRSFVGIGGALISLVALCAAAGIVVKFAGYRGFGYYPFLCLRHFVVALAMFLLLFGPVGRAIATVLSPLRRPAAALASISYGLYVLHYPLLVQWSVAKSLAGLGGAMVILIGASWLVDRELPRWIPKAPTT